MASIAGSASIHRVARNSRNITVASKTEKSSHEDEKKVIENPRKLILKYYVSYFELFSCLFQVPSSSCLSSVVHRDCRFLHDIPGIAALITSGIVQNAYTQYCVFGGRICANRVSVHTQPLERSLSLYRYSIGTFLLCT